jgi:hypothetical protein
VNVRIDRPDVPAGYGAETATTYLEWSEVTRSLSDSLHYWIGTTRPDGRPHVVPRWGVWIDDRFWYDGSPETRHVRNLVTEERCTLNLESGEKVTIVEGRSKASPPIGRSQGALLSEEFTRKYGSRGYTPGADAWADDQAGGLRVITPEKVIAWTRFPEDITRFSF